jgi:hypothetical protein
MISTARAIARDITPPVIWRFAGRLDAQIRRRPQAHKPMTLEPMAKDPFLTWLSFIVPGWLHRGNVELFDYCFANLPSDAPVIEIGSFAGLSLNTIIHLLKRQRRSNPVFSVDDWNFDHTPDVYPDDSTVSPEEYQRLVIETFRRNVSMFSRGNLPHHIVSNSDRFFAEWAAGNSKTDFFSREVVLGGPISFAYIDGDHTHEQPLKDFQNVDRHLEVGGFVVFDDSADEHWPESVRAAREAARRSDYRLVDKRPNYCIQKIA